MIVAKWKKGFESLYKADANLVANEILEIGDNVSPKEVLDKAKQEDTELHKCFEWDDGIAAEKYRLSQAGGILRTLVIKREETESCTKPEIRRFTKPKETKDINQARLCSESRTNTRLLFSDAELNFCM